MLVYRITLAKWSTLLTASGSAARWNSNGRFMLYTASTRALACLENVVHRKSIGRDDFFKIMVIDVPDDLKTEQIALKDLPPDWTAYANYAKCQAIGDNWLNGGTTAILKTPSSIIAEEYNYLLNPQHPDFKRLSIHAIENFSFDERLVPKARS
ncbi:MAG TPA: RES family NAD+ phosphorylase [Puia sp.]|jgi:RES domain-containing protein